MEKEELDLIDRQATIRMNDFYKRINQLIINENLGLSLYEIEQLLNRKITSPDSLPKHKHIPKYIPYYSEVEKIYHVLEIYKYMLPEYNETWLLYGKGSMFNPNANNIEESDFVARFESFKDYATENVTFLEDTINFNATLVHENKVKHFLYNHIITEFANVFAGINKLKNKLKLKDLNISWLLSNEGDMFEKNSK